MLVCDTLFSLNVFIMQLLYCMFGLSHFNTLIIVIACSVRVDNKSKLAARLTSVRNLKTLTE